MEFAPIVLFVYNRVDHTRKTVEALLKNKESSESKLFIFSDGPKDNSVETVKETRKYLSTIKGFKSVSICERECNYGLSRNLIDGISKIIEKHKRAIIVEDDIVTSPYFLQFMNEALEKYKDDDRVASIQGYCFPVDEDLPETFFYRLQGCWGWGTWERAWKFFNPNSSELYNEITRKKLIRDFNLNDSYQYMKMLRENIEGKNDSWAIRWYASAFLRNQLALYPGKSLVLNDGFDGRGGTHNREENHLLDTEIKSSQLDLSKNDNIREIKSNCLIVENFLRRTLLGKRLTIGRFFHHLGLDFMMVGPLKGWRWKD